MSDSFETRKRPDGESFRALREGSPTWMQSVAREGHMDSLPNDTSYNAVEVCVDAIAEDVEVEPPVYTYTLTEWIANDPSHLSYIDDALVEMGNPSSGAHKLLEYAYMLWINEVFYAVHAELEHSTTRVGV